MARLTVSEGARPARAFFRASSCAILVAFLLGGCNQSLAIKNELVQKVDALSAEWHGIKTLVPESAYAASIGYFGANVYVLYYDSVLQKLLLIKSPDKGATWGSPFTVDSISGDYSRSNNLVVDGSNLYISYWRAGSSGNDEVYFIVLNDTGSGFTKSNYKTLSTLSSYPYGYENAIAFDNSNVYVVYAAAYGPVFTYAAKAATMTFSTPVYIDSTITAQTTLTGVSMLLDSGGNIDAAYVDNSSGTSKLKCAIFAPTASLPISVSGIGTIPSGLITSPSYPSAANQYLISYYNTYPTPKIYELYERYTWSDINLHIVSTVTTIDSSSSDVGLGGVLLLQGNTLYSTYYDTANSVLKFAVGNRVPLNNQTGYSFTTSTITTAGSSNFCCRLISDQSTNTFYVIFSDSSGSGALKLAKSLDLGATW